MHYLVSKHASRSRCKSGICTGVIDFRRPKGARSPVRAGKCPKCGWEHWKTRCLDEQRRSERATAAFDKKFESMWLKDFNAKFPGKRPEDEGWSVGHTGGELLTRPRVA